MSDAKAWLRALRAAPHDRILRKVFADWLDERGRHIEAHIYRLLAEVQKKRELFRYGFGLRWILTANNNGTMCAERDLIRVLRRRMAPKVEQIKSQKIGKCGDIIVIDDPMIQGEDYGKASSARLPEHHVNGWIPAPLLSMPTTVSDLTYSSTAYWSQLPQQQGYQDRMAALELAVKRIQEKEDNQGK